MLDTYVYDRAVKEMELVCSTEDKRNIGTGTIMLIPCRNTGASSITLAELVSEVNKKNFASNERQARQLVCDQNKIINPPKGNKLFVGTRWRCQNRLLWIPYVSTLYFPNLKKTRMFLSLMNIPETLFVQHNNHYFVQID